MVNSNSINLNSIIRRGEDNRITHPMPGNPIQVLLPYEWQDTYHIFLRTDNESEINGLRELIEKCKNKDVNKIDFNGLELKPNLFLGENYINRLFNLEIMKNEEINQRLNYKIGMDFKNKETPIEIMLFDYKPRNKPSNQTAIIHFYRTSLFPQSELLSIKDDVDNIADKLNYGKTYSIIFKGMTNYKDYNVI